VPRLVRWLIATDIFAPTSETTMTEHPHSPTRRHLLAGTASALAGVGLASWTGTASGQAKPLPAYATWKDADSLIVHSANTMETRRGELGTSVITSSDRLYIRNNLPPPDASIVDDPDSWKIEIAGVKNPRTMSVGELKRLGVDTVAMVLQCSGNGRGFFPSKPSGTPWTVGAAGCVIWSGVPISAVVEALGGISDGMPYMTGTGGEKLPEGIDPKSVVVERSVPVKAVDDSFLAWELNGEPIPLAHGGPLRLIVPGYQGVNNIKYIKKLAFTEKESEARIMAHGYRMTPPGEKADPSQPSVLEMGVKSWIDSPVAQEPIPAGRVQIVGVAFSGTSAVKRVEVSVDGGKTWRDAKFFGPNLGKFAWRQFMLETDLPAGEHKLASRATDEAGDVQPEVRVDNVRGYNNTSWADHAVTVNVA
jgi:DMSO/TMAO reductase YedYZ molybdopterin-dependent catalytic subunit